MQATLHHRAHLAKSGAKLQLFLETTKHLYNKILTSYKLHLTQQKNHSADDTDNHSTSYIEQMLDRMSLY